MFARQTQLKEFQTSLVYPASYRGSINSKTMTYTNTHMHTHRTWTKKVILKLDHLCWIFQVPRLNSTQFHSAYTVSELTVNFRHIKRQGRQSVSKQSGRSLLATRHTQADGGGFSVACVWPEPCPFLAVCLSIFTLASLSTAHPQCGSPHSCTTSCPFCLDQRFLQRTPQCIFPIAEQQDNIYNPEKVND